MALVRCDSFDFDDCITGTCHPRNVAEVTCCTVGQERTQLHCFGPWYSMQSTRPPDPVNESNVDMLPYEQSNVRRAYCASANLARDLGAVRLSFRDERQEGINVCPFAYTNMPLQSISLVLLLPSCWGRRLLCASLRSPIHCPRAGLNPWLLS